MTRSAAAARSKPRPGNSVAISGSAIDIRPTVIGSVSRSTYLDVRRRARLSASWSWSARRASIGKAARLMADATKPRGCDSR